MTMRRSPRRPLILRRRKLPFQQNDSQAAEPQKQSAASDAPKPAVSASSQCYTNGIRILDHPSLSDTQVVVIPKTADLQTVIGALTAKGKESGVRGPNKFILLGANGSLDNGSICQSATERDDASKRNTAGKQVKEEAVCSPEATPFTRIKTLNKDLDCGPLDDSLTNIQWLGGMTTHPFEQDLSKQMADKENQSSNCQSPQTQNTQINAEDAQQPVSERPPYSYMAMIQFAINSRKDRRMTLKEIYTWIEEHFPYFRQVAKPGWKNSIRHNLSLHDMFIRETSEDGKISFWTIQPEANRCLTLDQVYKPEFDPVNASVPVPLLLCPQQQQRRISPDPKRIFTGSERKMKPLLPRTESYLIPIQLPITSSIYLPPLSAPSRSQKKNNSSRGCKRVRIAPKVTQSEIPAMSASMLSQKSNDIKVKKEPADIPVKCETPKSALKRPASNSRRKQRLIHSQQEEPVLLCPDNTFFDSGVASDVTFQDMQETELEESGNKQLSPDRDLTFKTPIKSSSQLISSTPSKPPSNVLPEPWIVTPVGKESHNILDFSPIRTPGGPAVTPRHDYTTFSLNNTPFKDLPLFSSPRELLTSTASRGTGPIESPFQGLKGSCSRELLQAGGAATSNRSITEGLVLDTMNDSLSKILVDISFPALDDEDLGTANISWSEFMPQFM